MTWFSGFISIYFTESSVFLYLAFGAYYAPQAGPVLCVTVWLTIWQYHPGSQWLIQMDLQEDKSYPAGTHWALTEITTLAYFLGHVLSYLASGHFEN